MPKRDSVLDAIDRVIIAVHGVRSWGEWGDTLHTFIRQDQRFDRVLYLTFDYPKLLGIIGWGATWMPWIRHHYTNWMTRKLEDVATRFPGKPVSVVAHSYGTWMTYHAIRRHSSLTLDRLICVGAVLKHDDPLSPVREGKITQLMNHFSSNDKTVQFAPPPFGKAGMIGFLGALPPTVSNVGDWRMGHSGYWNQSAFYKQLVEDLAQPAVSG